jgi:hypothetical protein
MHGGTAEGEPLRMRKTTTSIVVVAGVAGLLLALGAAPASAHEERKVGKYTLAVGFGDEPAHLFMPNTSGPSRKA